MARKSIAPKLFFNGEHKGHADEIKKHLRTATRFEAMIAFAKYSGLNELDLKALQKKLKGGMKGRIVVGQDFYITDPAFLDKAYSLSKRKERNLTVYLMSKKSGRTFHPKVYAFEKKSGYAVITGSANLTTGGLSGNWEASVVLEGHSSDHFDAVCAYIDDLVETGWAVELTPEAIEDYRRRHKIFRDNYKIADKRTKETKTTSDHLQDMLSRMRRNSSEHGFTEQMRVRNGGLQKAKRTFGSIRSMQSPTQKSFRPLYETLVSECFHSGSIHRKKNDVIQTPRPFQDALLALSKRRNLSVAETFDLIHPYFLKISGAGPNVMTEVLHAYDNTRFMVMNQNSVKGMRFAGFTNYPRHPQKNQLTGEIYQRFCQDADTVRQKLSLKDFTELDALFNYVYWQ